MIYFKLWQLILATIRGDTGTKHVLEKIILKHHKHLALLIATSRIILVALIPSLILLGILMMGLATSHYIVSLYVYHIIHSNPWTIIIYIIITSTLVPFVLSFLVMRHMQKWYNTGLTLDQCREIKYNIRL